MSNKNNKNLIFFSFILAIIFIFGLFMVIPKNASAYYCSNDWIGTQFVGHCDSSNSTYNGYNYNNNNYYNNNSNYYNNNNGNYSGTNPIPYISSTTPSSSAINGDTSLTVYGSNFIQGSVARWNNSDRPTTFVNGGTLRVQLYNSDLATKGDYPVVVFNPASGGGISNTVLFAVTSNASATSTTIVKNYTNKKSTSTVSKTSTTSDKNTNTTVSGQPTTGAEVGGLAAGAIFGSNGFLPSSIFQWIFFFIMVLLAIILWRKLYVSDEERRNTPLKHA